MSKYLNDEEIFVRDPIVPTSDFEWDRLLSTKKFFYKLKTSKMPVRRFRKKNYRKKPYRRYRRKLAIPRPKLSTSTHIFVRRGTKWSVSATTADAYGGYYGTGGFASALSDTANSGELTSLYDSYKILAIQYKIIPVNITDATMPCQLYIWNDYDDATNPAMTDYYERKHKEISLNGNRVITWTCNKPAVASEVSTGMVTAYAQKRSPLLDCGYSSVPHYGMKFVLRGRNGAQPEVEVEAKIVLLMKTPR